MRGALGQASGAMVRCNRDFSAKLAGGIGRSAATAYIACLFYAICVVMCVASTLSMVIFAGKYTESS